MSHRIAVSIMLSTDPSSSDVLLVERNPELRFMGGYFAFPGGVLDDVDSGVGVRNLDDSELAPFIVAAARELLEEVGVWMARGGRPDRERLAEWRKLLLAERMEFADILQEANAHLDARDFEPVGRITTPPFAPRRYDTWFLSCRLPKDDSVEIWPGELVAGRFMAADEALASWRAGGMAIVPPVLIFLQQLEGSSVTACLPEVRRLTASFVAGELHPVYFSPGVLLAPLEVRTKPPATHTNAYVVGDSRLFLVDPAATEASEQSRLWHLLDGLIAEGRELVGILLTHAHPDHVGAVAEASRRYGIPVWAHEKAADRLPMGVELERTLSEGDHLDLGLAPDGGPDWSLEIFELPGHSPDHLAFRESRFGAMIVGDLVSTLSSVLIEPGEGHLMTYLSSLERLRELCHGTLYPGHGPPSREGRKAVTYQIGHRQKREQQLLACLEEAPRTALEIVEAVYTDVDRRLWPMAERSVLAGLIKLQEEDRVERSPKGYSLIEKGTSCES